MSVVLHFVQLLYFMVIGMLLSYWYCHKKVGRQITHKWDYLLVVSVVLLIVYCLSYWWVL